MTELDELLARPIAPIADDGFSARVMRRVRIAQIRAHWTTIAAWLIAIALVVALTPLHAVGVLLGAGVPQIAGFWGINLGLWLIAASLLAVRPLSRL